MNGRKKMDKKMYTKYSQIFKFKWLNLNFLNFKKTKWKLQFSLIFCCKQKHRAVQT